MGIARKHCVEGEGGRKSRGGLLKLLPWGAISCGCYEWGEGIQRQSMCEKEGNESILCCV
jgi:hypothetical protein